MNCRDDPEWVERDKTVICPVMSASLGIGCLCKDRGCCLGLCLCCRNTARHGSASEDLVHPWKICRERVVERRTYWGGK